MGLRDRLGSTAVELKGLHRLAGGLLPKLPRRLWSPAALLERHARLRGARAALSFEAERFAWADVDARANQYAQLFARRGIGAGDPVALMMDNRPELLFAELGLNKLGAVAALINTNLAGQPLAHALAAAKPRAAVVGSEHAAVVRDLWSELPLSAPERNVWAVLDGPQDSAHGLQAIDEELGRQAKRHPHRSTRVPLNEPQSYIYTSGTTGLPKAAVITNSRFLMASSFFAFLLHEAAPDDTIYCALPMYHSNGQWGAWGTCLATGAQLALRRKFSASAFWDDVRYFGATRFVYIGELCRYLLNQPVREGERDHHVRIAVGNGLRPDIWESFQKRFGVPLIREFYGATESNAVLANVEGRVGMIGRLKPGQVLVRCDPSTGEILRNAHGFCDTVRPGQRGLLLGRINPLLRFDGYVDTEATRKKVERNVFKAGDAYFNTGDVLELHDDGWVSFADRVGDTFRWKGENVSTTEVAEALSRVPGVLEANVYGVEVPGTEGRAGMASLNADGALDLEQLARHVKTRLPRYQWPWFVRVQRQMRVTGTLKHQKVAYREEGYDPDRVADPLYFFDGDNYVRLDRELYGKIRRGEIRPG